MGPAKIVPVKNSKELRDFLALPNLLYREDPYWVKPLCLHGMTLQTKSLSEIWRRHPE